MPQAQTVAVPHRVPFAVTPENRDKTTGKDAKLINCYVEKSQTAEGSYSLFKRAGLRKVTALSPAAGVGNGIYNWNGDIYTVVGSALFKNGLSLGAVDNTNGIYHFSVNNTTNPSSLQLHNGVKAYNYDPTHGLVQITDVDYPSTTCKGWVFLDGTSYVMDRLNGIHGSDINDTVNWDALNKVLAQIEPDNGIALAKHLVYVVALKQWTTEIFYDAGNPTGSPLVAVQGAKIGFGCVHSDSVQDIDGVLFWLSNNRSAQVQVMKLDNLKAETVSTKPIERLLGGVNLNSVYSLAAKLNGHSFYVVTFPLSNLTLVYDIKENLWSQWTDPMGNYFPYCGSSYSSSNQRLLQHCVTGAVYEMNDDYVNDDGSTFAVDVYTPKFDGGTDRRKLLSQMRFICDQTQGNSLTVQVSDDDYQTWSQPRYVDLSLKNPSLSNCGTFTKRAWHLHHRLDKKLRLMAVDLQIDIGTL